MEGGRGGSRPRGRPGAALDTNPASYVWRAASTSAHLAFAVSLPGSISRALCRQILASPSSPLRARVWAISTRAAALPPPSSRAWISASEAPRVSPFLALTITIPSRACRHLSSAAAAISYCSRASRVTVSLDSWSKPPGWPQRIACWYYEDKARTTLPHAPSDYWKVWLTDSSPPPEPTPPFSLVYERD